MNNQQILEQIGLTEKESLIYLALIEHGPATVAAIAQYTGIHRPLIYKALPGMVSKGLVSNASRGKRTVYCPAPPEALESVLEGVRAQFRELLPRLRSAYESVDTRPIVKYLVGKREISGIFSDLVTTLKPGDIFYRYSAARDLHRANTYLPTDYRMRRDAKHLERYLITSEAQARGKNPRLERDVKTIPPEYDLFNQDVTQIIYSNRVAFIDYNSDTALLIENAHVAEFQRKLFMLLFKML